MDAGEIWGVVLGVAGIVVTAGFSIWAINDAREQVRRFIRTQRNLEWTKLQNEMVWLFVDPTDKSHTKEVATGLAVFALLANELDPDRSPEALREAAENEALELAEKLVHGGYATWNPQLDAQKVRERLNEWRIEKNKVRAKQSSGARKAKRLDAQ